MSNEAISAPSATAMAGTAPPPGGGDISNKYSPEEAAAQLNAQNDARRVREPMPDIGKYRLGASVAASPLAHAGPPTGSGDVRKYQAKLQKETFFDYALQTMTVVFTKGTMTKIEASLRDGTKCDALTAELNKKWGTAPYAGYSAQWPFTDGTVTVVNASGTCRVMLVRSK
jgi:hypothetical protein